MITIKEDYVSLETAKLLKDKGFDQNCATYYLDGQVWRHYHGEAIPKGKQIYAAPTQAMAMKWLREVHKISIEITSIGYLIDNDVEWECDIKAGHRLYFKYIPCEKSFESIAEKAIKYCLEDLI